MTDNLPERQRPPELSANRKLTTLSVDEMIRVANGFWRSGVFKKGGRDNMAAEELFVVILAGQEMGLGPAQAVMGISMIEGKPNMSANIQAALLKASGKYDYTVTWGYDEAMVDQHGNPYPNPNWCEITVKMVEGEEIGTTRFSMADADRAGLLRASKNGKPSNYLVYPRNMLFARCISNAVAFFAPDSTMTRTYHEGEIGSDTAPPPPKLEAGQPAEPPSEHEAQQAIEEAVPDAEVEVMPEGDAAGEVRPGESSHEAMARMEREEALPDDTFNPETEPPPPVVTPPQTFAGSEDPGPAEPTVETHEHEDTLTPGQMRLVHAKCGQLALTDERRREILTEITGEGHLDRIPRRFMDAILERLNAELEAHGDA